MVFISVLKLNSDREDKTTDARVSSPRALGAPKGRRSDDPLTR